MLAENKIEIENRILRACGAAKRSPKSVRVLAVTKGHSVAQIHEAMAAGYTQFGENYVQEWLEKSRQLRDKNLHWHFIGHLQSNKAKAVVGQVELIHSLDRDSLAKAIGERAQVMGIQQSVLVEINVAGESTKAGVQPDQAESRIRAWAKIPGLRLAGLMIMPPAATEPEASRDYFRQARNWLASWSSAAAGHPWQELSMGTSQDFAIAIEEGATLVRLGTVLFGPRP